MDTSSQNRWSITRARFISYRRLVAAFVLAGILHVVGVAFLANRVSMIRPQPDVAHSSVRGNVLDAQLVAAKTEMPPTGARTNVETASPSLQSNSHPHSPLPQVPQVAGPRPVSSRGTRIGEPSASPERRPVAIVAPTSRQAVKHGTLFSDSPTHFSSSSGALRSQMPSSSAPQSLSETVTPDPTTFTITASQTEQAQSRGEGQVPTVRVGLCDIPAPDYPHRAKRLGNEGRVELLLSIDESGHPTQVEVVASSHFDDLDAVAKSAASRGTCQPYLESGQPRPVRRIQVIQFTLDN